MNRVFEPRGCFTVPDGTDVSPFLNATDINQKDVPWGVLGEMSIAAGKIRSKLHSAVHMHPVVTHVTYVVAGKLTVRMKDTGGFYDLPLHSGQAALTKPGTLFQLRNDSDAVADVLYIASPSYVFEIGAKGIVYDDAVRIADSWEELEKCNYDVPAIRISASEANVNRERSKRRLAAAKGIV